MRARSRRFLRIVKDPQSSGGARAALLCFAALLIVVTVVGQVPGNTRFSVALQNGAHAPVFFLLTLIFLRLCNAPARSAYPRAVLIGLALGVAIEGVQSLIGGDADALDVVHDMAGVAAALAWHSLRLGSGERTIKWLALGGAVLVAFGPLAWCTAAYARRAAIFPVLASFRSGLDTYFFKPQPGLDVQKLGGEGALRVVLPPGEWPGVELEEPSPDWSAYRSLVVELTNLSDREMRLHLRVHDLRHTFAMTDRFNADIELPPQRRQTFEFAIERIRRAPATRTMDLTHVRSLIVFGNAALAGQTIYINRISLQR